MDERINEITCHLSAARQRMAELEVQMQQLQGFYWRRFRRHTALLSCVFAVVCTGAWTVFVAGNARSAMSDQETNRAGPATIPHLVVHHMELVDPATAKVLASLQIKDGTSRLLMKDGELEFLKSDGRRLNLGGTVERFPGITQSHTPSGGTQKKLWEAFPVRQNP